MDVRTNYQKKVAARHEKVEADFRRVMPESPSPHRAMSAVAQMNDLTLDGVRRILIERGVYVPNSESPVRI